MNASQAAYQLRVLFEQKITAHYYALFKGSFGRVQADVLSCLYDQKSTNVQQVASFLDIPKQHASKILARLQEQQLVEKCADPKDKRAALFSLSDKGHAFMQEQLETSNARFESRFAALSKEEQAEFLRAMEQVTHYLEKL